MSGTKATPIGDYGLIGNGRTAALVSRLGSIDWACFPRFDSESSFAALLDPDRGGAFAIAPSVPFDSSQRYLEGTNVLETSFTTALGRARVTDCFSVSSERHKAAHLGPDHEILRIVEGNEGRVPFELRYAPRHDYGAKDPLLRSMGRLGIACGCGPHLLLLRASIALPEPAGELRHAFELRAGERAVFSLIYTEEAPAVIPPLGDAALDRLEETVRYWRSWISQCRYDGLHPELVRRSALALKLLTYAPSGAIVAAPTTSLPERVGGPRNWDYRYCWLRDASFTVRALVELGYHDEASAFVSWMLHTTRLTRPRVQMLYSVYGHARIPERTLPLDGYGGSRPVRIGNAAGEQHQLDVYGEVLDAIYGFLPEMSAPDGETRRFILDLGLAIRELWELPDDGIWEARSGPAHHTHSKALAWIGLDRLVKISARFGWALDHDEIRAAAARIRNAIESRGFNSRLGAYTATFGGDRLDASLLVLPILGYCDPRSARIQGTCDAIHRDLSRKGLIYRYLGANDGVDPEGRGEGAFGICSFWMTEALAKSGRIEEARAWFEHLLRRANTVGLWPEEIDPETGEFLGNYPQGFTHIGLINAAITLSRAARITRAA